MNPESFVDALITDVIDANARLYRDLFANTSSDAARNPYWRRALELYRTLDAERREIFFEILRQVSVDTTSNLLGVLDGSSYLRGAAGEFRLTYDDGDALNGDLQDEFLARVEQA